MNKQKSQEVIPFERIASGIYLIRGKKVMLDTDLAELYGVQTRVLNQSVARNIDRFPEDFMFQLSQEEWDSLRSQIVTLKNGKRGTHRKYMPYVFTEHGILMLSSVLRSERAVQINIAIMRAFVRMREMLASHEEFARKIQEYDHHIANLYDLVNKLLEPPKSKSNPIGFVPQKESND